MTDRGGQLVCGKDWRLQSGVLQGGEKAGTRQEHQRVASGLHVDERFSGCRRLHGVPLQAAGVQPVEAVGGYGKNLTAGGAYDAVYLPLVRTGIYSPVAFRECGITA